MYGIRKRHGNEDRISRGRRSIDWLGVSLLDFKLGARMLFRYPGLTIVGGLALAFAIWVAAGSFEILRQLVSPTLPLPGGERIVALRNWNVESNGVEPRAAFDLERWRGQLTTVRDVGAARTLLRNLVTDDGRGEPVEVAEISASAFQVTGVPPMLGRYLLADDERAGAPLVIVIGHELWQRRFAGDSSVIGSSVRIGGAFATVIGVMPVGYGFPISQSLWMPLRLAHAESRPRQGPPLQIFGRLAPGASIEDARTELANVGARAAAEFPEAYEHLRPQVLPHAKSFLNIPFWASVGLMSSNLLLVMLLALICANVALLMFARAATRESEIIVRTALGASRGRIIGQLFAEALVLGGLATAVGLAAAGFGMRWVLGIIELDLMDGRPLPFWIEGGLSPTTVLYTVLLTLFAAAIMGVLPALKVTRGVGARLRESSAGAGGLRFGGVWTVVIVTQVALTVAFPAVAFFLRQDSARLATYDLGFPAHEYLSVRIEMDREDPALASGDTTRAAFLARYDSVVSELERRLASDPAVTGVTVATRLPLMYHEWNQIEVDDGAVEPRDARGHRMGAVWIDEDYFEVLGVELLAGRDFHAAELESGAQVAIVNQPFVDDVLGGRNPIGRRIRHVASESSRIPTADGPWYEIVGVARDLGTKSGYGRAGIYHPMARGRTYPLSMAVRLRGDPATFAPALRTAATTVNARLRLHDVVPLDQVIDSELAFYGMWIRLTVLVSAVALLLSLAGIYAVMSFTVARRTREIGIRVALGAEPRRVLLAIFRRPLAQVGVGVLTGGALVGLFMSAIEGGAIPAGKVALLAAYALLMLGICALACVVPTRRALAVQPTEALRSEG